METLDAAKKWFQSNVDTIMNVYSYQHHIQKEDIFLGESFSCPLKFSLTH